VDTQEFGEVTPNNRDMVYRVGIRDTATHAGDSGPDMPPPDQSSQPTSPAENGRPTASSAVAATEDMPARVTPNLSDGPGTASLLIEQVDSRENSPEIEPERPGLQVESQATADSAGAAPAPDEAGHPTHVEPPVGPFSELAPSGTPCRVCGEVHRAGRFRSGCAGPRLTTGLHSALVRQAALPSLVAARAALADQQAAIETDLGGSEAMTTVLRGAVRQLVVLGLFAEHLAEDMLRAGVVTAKGKRRAALAAYLEVTDRITALRRLIGVERKARPVDPLQAIHDAVRRASDPPPASEAAS
jgi:hypothetical protein